MPFDSLRSFLEKLEAEGQLLRIPEEVSPEPDIGAAACAAAKSLSGPALLFERVRGYGDMQVAMNVHGSPENHALILDMPRDTGFKGQFHELVRRFSRYPIPPVRVSDAPCKEVVIDKEPNLYKELPLFRINPWDGGFYLSKACVVSADPENPESRNIGMYRIQVKDKDRIGVQVGHQHDIAIQLRKAEAMGVPLRVAVAVSNDPVTSLVASTPLRYNEDEYSMIGAVRGAPAQVVLSERGGLPVPAGAELIIEGEIIPRHRAIEGPFAEFTGYYSASFAQGEIKVDTITRRKGPIIFENLYTGKPWTEIDYMMALSTGVAPYRQMKEDFPEVEAINAMYTHGYGTIISARMRFAGFAKTLGMRLLTTPHGITYPKFIIVVDEDIDPFNLQEVMWAITVRFRPDRDLMLVPCAAGSTLDPAQPVRGITTKVIIDATKPLPPDVPMADGSLVDVPPEVSYWLSEIAKRRRKG